MPNFQLKVIQENKTQKSLGSLSVAAEVIHDKIELNFVIPMLKA